MNKKWIVAASVILTVVAAASFQYLDFSKELDSESQPLLEDLVVEEVSNEVFLYGINVTGLNIVEGTVSKNQTLASILAPFNVPYQIIDEIVVNDGTGDITITFDGLTDGVTTYSESGFTITNEGDLQAAARINQINQQSRFDPNSSNQQALLDNERAKDYQGQLGSE